MSILSKSVLKPCVKSLDSWVSLPLRQSRIFHKRGIPEIVIQWLLNMEKTNWKSCVLRGTYKVGETTKEVIWRLPNTLPKRESCNTFKYLICPNRHELGTWLQSVRLSCFRSVCEACGLTKWLPREANRVTQRIEKYFELPQNRNRKPIHVIVSPSWDDKFLSYDILKRRLRELLDRAGVRGGVVFFHHAGSPNKSNGHQWVVRPHFHVICDGWITDPRKIVARNGWVIKNKGIRKSVFSSVFYLLSHTSVCDQRVSSVSWFGTMSYRAKYASELVVDDDTPGYQCQYCLEKLVPATFVATDRGPPLFEGSGFVAYGDWNVVKTVSYDSNRRC